MPAASILAFEPHPAHLIQLAQNLAVNQLTARVTVVPRAAGIANGRVFLSDAGEVSRIYDQPADGRIGVERTDFFTTIGPRPIDILKLDCEGGEYDLIMDTRFATLAVAAIVLEWHAAPTLPDAEVRLHERLKALGFEVEGWAGQTSGASRSGMLWAYAGASRAAEVAR